MDKMASCPGSGVSQATGAGAIPDRGAGPGPGSGDQKDMEMVILW